jgi:endonuclease III
LEFEVPVREYDLQATLTASFACYLFREERLDESSGLIKWVGIVDPIKGVEIQQSRPDLLKVRTGSEAGDIAEYVLRYVTGLWFNPQINTLSSRIVQGTNLPSSIRVPWLFRNRWHVLYATLLSVHAQTTMSRAWFASVADLPPRKILEMSVMDLRELSQSVAGVSAGFRMRYLLETLTDIEHKHGNVLDALEDIAKMSPPLARLELCKVRNLGPKVVDCFLLNALGDLSAPPVDVHVARMAGEIGLIPKGMSLPSSYHCRKYICSEKDALELDVSWCPKAMRTQLCVESNAPARGTCIRAALSQRFENPGWIQAMLFSRGLNSPRLRERVRPPHVRVEHAVRTGARVPDSVTVVLSKLPEIECLSLYQERIAEVRVKFMEALDHLKGIQTRRDALYAVSLLHACRELRIPILIEEIVDRFGIPESLLSITMERASDYDLRVQLARPEAYIDRVARVFELPHRVTECALALASESRMLINPVSRAAAAVVVASQTIGHNLPLTHVAKALGITEVTLRNNVKKMQHRLLRSKHS